MKWVDIVRGHLNPLEYDNVYIQPLHETVACHWLFNKPNIFRLHATFVSVFCSVGKSITQLRTIRGFFQHCLCNWRNTNQYRFFIFNCNIFCKCLWIVFTRSYRSHVDWFAFKCEVLHFKIHFIVVGVGVLWDWSFLFFVCCCFGGFFVGIKRVKDHWLFQIIQHHYISSLITWGEVGHLLIAKYTDYLRVLEKKILNV